MNSHVNVFNVRRSSMTLLLWALVAQSVLPVLALAASSQSPSVALTASTPGVYAEGGNLYLALPIKNIGEAPALQVLVESIHVASGTLLTPVVLPVALGNIGPEEGARLDASFALSNDRAPRLSLMVRGTYIVNNRTLPFTLHRVLTVRQPTGQALAASVSVAPKVEQGSPFPPQQVPGGGQLENEQANVPPTPIGPFRPGAISPDTNVRIPGPNDSPVAARAAEDFGDPIVVTRNTSFAPNAGNPPDMSGASGGGIVFATANTFAAVSTDDGMTFTTLDPSTIWKDVFSPTKGDAGELIDGGLCCDQVVRYLPTIDRFVWLLQYWPTPTRRPGNLINKVRIAVAKPDDIRTKGAAGSGVWTYWDLTSATFGLGDHWMDYPDLAVGKNFLYFSINKVDTGGFVARIPLAELHDGATIHIDYTAPGVAAKMTRNASTEVFWSIFGSGSAIVVYSWKEETNVYAWRTVLLASWNESDYTAPDPAGKPWILGTAGFFNVQGAARRYAVNPFGGYLFNELWFAWSAGRDAANPYPSIELVRLDAATFSVIQQHKIRNSTLAFAYPDLVANELREGELVGFDVGFAFLWGGNSYYGNAGVGLFRLDATAGAVTSANTELVSVGTSDFSPTGGRSGDYFSVNPHFPQTGAFSAFVYRVLQDPTVSTGYRWDSRAIRFGRASFFEPPPPPR